MTELTDDAKYLTYDVQIVNIREVFNEQFNENIFSNNQLKEIRPKYFNGDEYAEDDKILL